MTAMDVLLLIRNDRCNLYYDPFDSFFTNEIISQKEIDRVLTFKKKEDIQITDVVHNIMLPSFKEIDHKGIMGFFVKECIEDKEIRKTLFYILRRDDYVTPFVDKLKELGLYDEFVDCCGSVYNEIMKEWAEQHGIDLFEKK